MDAIMTTTALRAPELQTPPTPTIEIVCDSENREEWLAARRAGIGASDIGVLFGASDWGSPYSLWCVKTGALDEPDLQDREFVFWGSVLEDAIIRGYGLRTGRPAVRFGLLIRSPDHPYLLATPDALTTDDQQAAKNQPALERAVRLIRRTIKDGRRPAPELVRELVQLSRGWWPLQTKNVSGWSSEHWIDGAPEKYRLQVQQEALLLDTTKGTAAALVGGQKLIWEDVSLDDFTARRIKTLATNFFQNHVETGVAPEVDGSKATKSALARRYPVAVKRAEPKILPAVLMDDAYELDQLKAQKKAVEEKIQAIENRVREAIGDDELAMFPDGSGFSYSTVEKGSYVVAASSSRQLRRTFPKKGRR